MSDIRRNIEFPTMDVGVNRARYESRELSMSGDAMCTTFIDLPTSYQDLLTSDKSFQRVICDQGAGNA